MGPAAQAQAAHFKRVFVFSMPRLNTPTGCFFRHKGFTPGMQQSGASAGRTGEVYGEVPPAVVGQGEPGLDVL